MRRREFITLLGGGATTALRSKSVAMSTWRSLRKGLLRHR
jgi:hypothetical protein